MDYLIPFLTLLLLKAPGSAGQEFPFYGLNLTDLSTLFTESRENDLIFDYNTTQKFFHVDEDSWFGYSISGYIREGESFCIVGSPKYHDPQVNERTGRVYRLDIDQNYPGCSVMPIPNNDAQRKAHGNTPYPAQSMFIGGSVSAFANPTNEVQLACDPRFLYMPNYSNESNLSQMIGTGHCVVYTGVSMNHLSLDSCSSHEEGSCLSGFSSSIKASSERGESFLALGLPGSYLTEGNVYFAHYKNQKLVSSSRLKSSPIEFKHVGYNLGYDVKVADINRLDLKDLSKEKSAYELAFGSKTAREPMNNKYQVVASATSWTPNDYKGIVMILNQAMDLGGIKYLKDNWGHVGSYFGYSLEVLDLDGNGVAEIIVSSPYYSEKRNESRSDSTLKPDIGRVYVFYALDSSDSQSFNYDTENPVILQGLKLKWGRFGHSLANLGDIDGDGTEDLGIGCPFCRMMNPDAEDKGAVFIYFGRKKARIEDKPMQVMFAENLPRESKLTMCQDDYRQRSSYRVFKSFGWSLSGGVDLDANSSPDVLVGDYDSGQIVGINSRGFLWFEDPQWTINRTEFINWSSGDDSYCNNEKCRYKVELSILVRGRKKLINRKNLALMVTLDLDALIDEDKRIGDSSELNPLGGPSMIQRKVMIDELAREDRRITILNLIFEPKLREVRKNNWMPVRMNATIEPLEDSGNIPWSMHPYLGKRSFTSEALYFTNKHCGPDQICHCDLQIKLINTNQKEESVIYYRERVTQRNITFGLANFGENAYRAELNLKIPKQFSYTTPSDLSCNTDSEIDKDFFVLKCSIGDPLGNTGLRFRPFTFNLNTASAFTLLTPRSKNATLDENEKTYPEELTVLASLTSGNPDKELGNNMVSLTYKLRLSAKVQLSSSSMEGAIMDRRNFSRLITSMQKIEPAYIGPQIKHTYLVTNDGPSPIENLQVNISIPIMTRDREHLLYILDRIRYQDIHGGPAITVDTLPSVISTDANFNGTCFIPQEFVNPLMLQAVDKANGDQLKAGKRYPRSIGQDYSPEDIQAKRRTERDSEAQESFMSLSSIMPNGRSNQQEVIRCGQEFADLGKPICAKVVCHINKLNSHDAVRINLRAWVWSDTLFRHKISDIGVVTEATCTLPKKAFNIHVHGERVVEPLVIEQSFVFEGIKSLITNDIPIWPIILGILVGATLLTCIIIAMWRCGFFKRKRWYEHSDMHNGNAVLDSSKMAHL